MKTYVSILRGINVGGRKVLMTDLKALYEGLKLKKVTTYIQSGNVLFTADEKQAEAALSEKIRKAIEKQYGFEVPVIIRDIAELETVLRTNPFLAEKNIDAEKLHVTFLAEAPEKSRLVEMSAVDFPPDRFRITGRDVFLHCPVSYGETKLSNNFFEKKLKVSATTRNWKTVNTLTEMARALQG